MEQTTNALAPYTEAARSSRDAASRKRDRRQHGDRIDRALARAQRHAAATVRTRRYAA